MSLKNEQEEAIKRITVAKKTHIDLEKRKHADLLAARMTDAALKSEAKQKHLEELYDTKIAKLQSSVHDLEEFIKQCVKLPRECIVIIITFASHDQILEELLLKLSPYNIASGRVW